MIVEKLVPYTTVSCDGPAPEWVCPADNNAYEQWAARDRVIVEEIKRATGWTFTDDGRARCHVCTAIAARAAARVSA